MYAKHKWMSGCTEGITVLSPLINHIIILAAALPSESHTSRQWLEGNY
jgi:hypothetical protein